MPLWYGFLLIFFAVLVIATIAACVTYVQKYKRNAEQIALDKEALKLQFDQVRKEKLDLSDKFEQLQSQEKTFRVAYEDWKSKYESIEHKYLQLRREFDQMGNTQQTTDKSSPQFSESIQQLDDKLESLSQQIQTLTQTPQHSDPELVSEMRSLLNQHMLILQQVIGEETFTKLTLSHVAPTDPLGWIVGIDENVKEKLVSSGIRSFEQIAEISQKEMRNWFVLFEDVDQNLIESWPLQAQAILQTKNKDKTEQV